MIRFWIMHDRSKRTVSSLSADELRAIISELKDGLDAGIDIAQGCLIEELIRGFSKKLELLEHRDTLPQEGEIHAAFDMNPDVEKLRLLSYVFCDDHYCWFNDGKIMIRLRSNDAEGICREVKNILDGYVLGYNVIILENLAKEED